VRLPPNPDMGMIHLPTFPGSARGAARVVAGNPENPSPPEHLPPWRSASQVVATLSSAGRGSQVIKPHLLYVAVQNPNMCTCCVAIEKNRARIAPATVQSASGHTCAICTTNVSRGEGGRRTSELLQTREQLGGTQEAGYRRWLSPCVDCQVYARQSQFPLWDRSSVILPSCWISR
jgi:hypothetical protein